MQEKKSEQEMKPKKGIFQTAREINAKEKHEKVLYESERSQQMADKQNKDREEYAKDLYKDKIDLIRLKHDDLKDNPFSEKKVKKEYTLSQRISNFLYHNKWWLGLGIFAVAIVSFFAYDIMTKERPDMTILLLSTNYELSERTDDIKRYFEQYAEDFNRNGKTEVSVYYIPVGDTSKLSAEENQSNAVRLIAEMQNTRSLIFIADKQCDDDIVPDKTLTDLKDYFPSDNNVKDYGFYLKDSKFAEEIGFYGKYQMTFILA